MHIPKPFERRHISRDINLEFEKKLTLGQRLADRVATFGELREMKWSELITMQQEQLRLLTQLMKEHLSADGNHPATS